MHVTARIVVRISKCAVSKGVFLPRRLFGTRISSSKYRIEVSEVFSGWGELVRVQLYVSIDVKSQVSNVLMSE